MDSVRDDGPTMTTEFGFDELLTAANLAELFRCTRDYIYRLNRKGQLPEPIRLGAGLIRWRRFDIAKLVGAEQ